MRDHQWAIAFADMCDRLPPGAWTSMTLDVVESIAAQNRRPVEMSATTERISDG